MRKISMATRDDLIAATGARYRSASRIARGRILDEFTAITGLHRKHAARLLRGARRVDRQTSRPERRVYDDEMDNALVILWEASDRICSKRLRVMLPVLVGAMERHGHAVLEPKVRSAVLAMSTATIDRRLAPFREGAKRRRRAPPSAAVKAAVPIRTFSDWGNPLPGFFEADLVAHSGPSAHGRFIQTLALTDIASGWTETTPLLFREQGLLTQALGVVQGLLPFAMLGLDTDNDTVFMNETIQGWCAARDITFTRSRPYRKNDQAWVEQKNGAIVRKLVGYRRYEGRDAAIMLGELYAVSRLFVNMFQPSFKLIEKTREGAKVTKRYHAPATPCQRLMTDPRISDEIRARLSALQDRLDPVDLLARMRTCQQKLIGLADGSAPPANVEPDARLEDFLAGLKDAWKVGIFRTAAKPSRTYRTRADPFEGSASNLEQLFENARGQTSGDLFEKLCAANPGVYTQQQFRTFQRRQKQWRAERADAMIMGNTPIAAIAAE